MLKETPSERHTQDDELFRPRDLLRVVRGASTDGRASCCEPLHPRMADMEPGPLLAGWLSAIDINEVSGPDKIVVMRAHQRMASHFQALVLRDMAAVTEALATDPDEPISDPIEAAEAAAAEIGVALHLARTATDSELSFALSLERRLPDLAAMLHAGRIDLRRARTIDRHTSHLPDAAARELFDRIANEAPDLTAGQLRACVRRLCITVDPDEATRRYTEAIADRRIVSEATDAGTTNLLGMDLAPDEVASITDRINTLAREMRGDNEARTMDQLRADIFVDLLSGTSLEAARRGVVDIRVDLATLAEMNEDPGDLAGYGPVIADIARRVFDNAQDAEWRVTITDPRTGQPTHSGVTSRRPSAAQRRRVEVRNPTCVFPGCRMPSTRSDLDHIIAVEDGGTTTDENLAPLCRRHHRLKHQLGWTYLRRSDGGYRWVTRLEQVITTARPPP